MQLLALIAWLSWIDNMKRPRTLRQLLHIAATPLWHDLTYETTARRNVKEFIAIVGNLRLSKITTTTMDSWRAAMEQKVGPSTINRKLTNIHSVLQFAVDRSWMTKLPKMPWQREPAGRIRWITPEEEASMLRLLAGWEEHEVAAFVTVLIETGMRRGELLRLEPKDVDGKWAHIWRTKTNLARSVPLTKRAAAALEGRLPWQLKVSRLRYLWDKLRRAMGLVDDPDFVLHALRHTAATRLLRKTGNIVMVQKLLGHKQIKTTLRYAHIADQDFLDAVVN